MKMNNSSFIISCTLALLMSVFADSICPGQVSFFTDENDWIDAVTAVEILITDADGVATANEVPKPPDQNAQLPGFLTFDSTNTLLSRSFTVETLEAGAGFTFSDGEPSPPAPQYVDKLSVGDIDNYEDDDWRLTLTSGPPAFGFAFLLCDNGDFGDPTDFIHVFDTSGNLLAFTSDLPSVMSCEFVGVVSVVPIGWIEYDDDEIGDDIAIGDFRFASVVLLGDVNLDGVVNLLDVDPFIDRISTGTFQAEADINQDGIVNLLDVDPFIALLGG